MKMKNKQKNSKLGFTLLELLVVVVIIGILAAIALPQYRKAVAKTQLAQIVMATKSVKSAAQRYYLANDNYPSSINDLDISIDSNIYCGVSTNFVYCKNENFVLWKSSINNDIACATKTQDKNSPLTYACKQFVKSPKCHLVETVSTCRYILKFWPCISCTGTSSI